MIVAARTKVWKMRRGKIRALFEAADYSDGVGRNYRKAGEAAPQALAKPIRAVLRPNRNQKDAERSVVEGTFSRVLRIVTT